jgi:hypothetical protein
VQRPLERGEAIIVFDPDAATTNIVPAGDGHYQPILRRQRPVVVTEP